MDIRTAYEFLCDLFRCRRFIPDDSNDGAGISRYLAKNLELAAMSDSKL